MINPRRKARRAKRKSTRRVGAGGRRRGRKSRRKGGRRRKASAYAIKVGQYMKQGHTMKEAARMAKGGGEVRKVGRKARRTVRRKSARRARKNAGRRKGRKARRKTSRRRRRSRANWGTRKGSLKGWDRRERHHVGYKKTRGGHYPWARSHKRRKHHKKSGRKYGKRRSRKNPQPQPMVDAKIGRHVKPHYGRAHMQFMSRCLRRRGGRHGLKACQSEWKHMRATGKYGHRKPRYKRRANPNGYPAVYTPGGGYAPSVRSHLGFPALREMFPRFEDIKAHPIATGVFGLFHGPICSVVGGGVAALIARRRGGVLPTAIGNVVGTELSARALQRWGPAKSWKSAAVKATRLGGYAVLVWNVAKAAMAGSAGGTSGLGGVKEKLSAAKNKAKALLAKGKSAIGLGIFGTGRHPGMGDATSSGWRQGYTGFEPMGVSNVDLGGPFDAGMAELDAKIRKLQSELGLSDFEMAEKMRGEGFDVGYLDYQLMGWEGAKDRSFYELGEYPSYVTDPYSGRGVRESQALGQYGSPSVPLLGDATVPPAEMDIFRSDFVS